MKFGARSIFVFQIKKKKSLDLILKISKMKQFGHCIYIYFSIGMRDKNNKKDQIKPSISRGPRSKLTSYLSNQNWTNPKNHDKLFVLKILDIKFKLFKFERPKWL